MGRAKIVILLLFALSVVSCGRPPYKIGDDVSEDDAMSAVEWIASYLHPEEMVYFVHTPSEHETRNLELPLSNVLMIRTRLCKDCHEGRLFAISRSEGTWEVIKELNWS
jgi:hypothetical protein